MEKSIKIDIPKGYEVDTEKSTFTNIVFKKISNNPFEKDLRPYQLYRTTFDGSVYCDKNIGGINSWPTRELAEASVALAQLSQLKEFYNKGWKPDWNENTTKGCILIQSDRPLASVCQKFSYFLIFKSREVAETFLENHVDLIEKAKPLL